MKKKLLSVIAALSLALTSFVSFASVASAAEQTIKLTDNFGWWTAYLYAWDSDGNELNGSWPGRSTETTINDYGEAEFVTTIPSGAVGIIFNNGNGAQTEDITDFNYEGFWMDGTTNELSHYIVTGYGEPIISSTPATATYTNVADYAAQFEGDAAASAWSVTVTPGDDTITSLDVKVNGRGSEEGAWTDIPEITDGPVVFAVAVNLAAKDVSSVTAVVNGADVDTTKTITVVAE